MLFLKFPLIYFWGYKWWQSNWLLAVSSKQFSLSFFDWWHLVISGFVSTLPSCLKALPAFCWSLPETIRGFLKQRALYQCSSTWHRFWAETAQDIIATTLKAFSVTVVLMSVFNILPSFGSLGCCSAMPVLRALKKAAERCLCMWDRTCGETAVGPVYVSLMIPSISSSCLDAALAAPGCKCLLCIRTAAGVLLGWCVTLIPPTKLVPGQQL